jgi:hypothetical protein
VVERRAEPWILDKPAHAGDANRAARAGEGSSLFGLVRDVSTTAQSLPVLGVSLAACLTLPHAAQRVHRDFRQERCDAAG